MFDDDAVPIADVDVAAAVPARHSFPKNPPPFSDTSLSGIGRGARHSVWGRCRISRARNASAAATEAIGSEGRGNAPASALSDERVRRSPTDPSPHSVRRSSTTVAGSNSCSSAISASTMLAAKRCVLSVVAGPMASSRGMQHTISALIKYSCVCDGSWKSRDGGPALFCFPADFVLAGEASGGGAAAESPAGASEEGEEGASSRGKYTVTDSKTLLSAANLRRK